MATLSRTLYSTLLAIDFGKDRRLTTTVFSNWTQVHLALSFFPKSYLKTWSYSRKACIGDVDTWPRQQALFLWHNSMGRCSSHSPFDTASIRWSACPMPLHMSSTQIQCLLIASCHGHQSWSKTFPPPWACIAVFGAWPTETRWGFRGNWGAPCINAPEVPWTEWGFRTVPSTASLDKSENSASQRFFSS